MTLQSSSMMGFARPAVLFMWNGLLSSGNTHESWNSHTYGEVHLTWTPHVCNKDRMPTMASRIFEWDGVYSSV
jgi:hypothetical protein